MNFTFISLFPEIIRSALNESITKRAIEKSLISFETINPRDYLKSKERIDDKVYGCLLYTSPSPRDRSLSRMPSSA